MNTADTMVSYMSSRIGLPFVADIYY